MFTYFFSFFVNKCCFFKTHVCRGYDGQIKKKKTESIRPTALQIHLLAARHTARVATWKISMVLLIAL